MLFASGCTGDLQTDIDGLKKDVEDLKEQVSDLKSLSETLDAKVRAGALIESVDKLEEPKSGWLIKFSDGKEIEVLNGAKGDNGTNGKDGAKGDKGDKGNDGKDGANGTNGNDGKDGANGEDGHTPVVEVKIDEDGISHLWIDGEYVCVLTGPKGEDGQDGQDGQDGKDGEPGQNGQDGKDGEKGDKGDPGQDGKDAVSPKFEIRPLTVGLGYSIWYNVTEGYPDDGWVDTKFKVADSNNDAHPISLIVYRYDGSVEFRLTDGSRYAFPLYSTAQHFEVMTTKAVFDGTEGRKIIFRVNPSGATVPTGSGADIARWALDQFATTRASYITPSEVFSLESILPDGSKTGQYVATIGCNVTAYDTSIDEFTMALVLDNNTGPLAGTNNDALVSSGPFSLSVALPAGSLFLSTSSLEFAAGEGTQTVNVVSAEDWSVTSDDDGWLTIVENEGSFSITTDANTTDVRTATITVDNGVKTEEVSVTQKGPNRFTVAYGEYDTSDWYGKNVTNYLISLETANFQQLGLYLNIISPKADFTKGTLDIAPGTYTFKFLNGTGNNNEFEVDISYDTKLYWEGAMYDRSSWPVSISGGSLIVSGDHNAYDMTVNINLSDGTAFSALFNGPLFIDNPNLDTSLDGDIDLGELTMSVAQFTANPAGDGTYDGFIMQGYSDGIYIDGDYRGTGWVAQAMINGIPNGTEILTDGEYSIVQSVSPGTAIAGGGNAQGNPVGTWIFRIENNMMVGQAPLRSGTVTSTYLDGEYTIEIAGVDDGGNNITCTIAGVPPTPTPAGVARPAFLYSSQAAAVSSERTRR